MDRVIAIDGPSGVGKSSVARDLAARLKWTYLDTGAMYRTVTLAWLHSKCGSEVLDDPKWLSALDMDFDEKQILLGGRRVNKEIRTQDVTANVSMVAARPQVRACLTDMQRRIALRRPCILDGRDIGTVVFPNAFFKVFLTASEEVRARRRWLQSGGAQSSMSLAEILADQARRDHQDANREVAPLKKAEDAYVFSTDELTQDEVVEALYSEANMRKDLLSEQATTESN